MKNWKSCGFADSFIHIISCYMAKFIFPNKRKNEKKTKNIYLVFGEEWTLYWEIEIEKSQNQSVKVTWEASGVKKVHLFLFTHPAVSL